VIAPAEHGAVRVVAAGLIAGLSLAAAPPARVADAGAIPDSVTMAAMRRAAGRGLLVYTATGQQEIRYPMLDSTGVWSAKSEAASRQRTALIETSDAPRPAVPAPISWSQIETVKTAGHHEWQAALVGAAVGLVVGAVTLLGSSHDEGVPGGLFAGSAAVGGLIGMLVGSVSGKQTLYRSQENH